MKISIKKIIIIIILIFLFISIFILSTNLNYKKTTNNLIVLNTDFVIQNSEDITSNITDTEKKKISNFSDDEIKKILQTDRTTLIKNYNLVVNGGQIGGMDGYMKFEGSSISDYVFMLPIQNLFVCVKPPSDFNEVTIQMPAEETPYRIVVIPDENFPFLNKFTSGCSLEQVREELYENKVTSYYAIDEPNKEEGNFLFWENNGLCYQFVFPHWNNNKLNEIRIWLPKI